MPFIKIHRPSSYFNRMRAYRVYIDGQQAGTISNDSEKEYEVAPGTHTVCIKIDWCSSPELTIQVGERDTRYLTTGPMKYSAQLQYVIFALLGVHLIASLVFRIDYLIILALIPFLYMVYMLSIGRKNFLTLAEHEWMNN